MWALSPHEGEGGGQVRDTLPALATTFFLPIVQCNCLHCILIAFLQSLLAVNQNYLRVQHGRESGHVALFVTFVSLIR